MARTPVQHVHRLHPELSFAACVAKTAPLERELRAIVWQLKTADLEDDERALQERERDGLISRLASGDPAQLAPTPEDQAKRLIRRGLDESAGDRGAQQALAWQATGLAPHATHPARSQGRREGGRPRAPRTAPRSPGGGSSDPDPGDSDPPRRPPEGAAR
jgi:hypothetical protein